MSKNQEPIMALGKNLRPFTSQYISLDRSSGESVEYPNMGLSGNMKTIRFEKYCRQELKEHIKIR